MGITEIQKYKTNLISAIILVSLSFNPDPAQAGAKEGIVSMELFFPIINLQFLGNLISLNLVCRPILTQL